MIKTIESVCYGSSIILRGEEEFKLKNCLDW